MAEIEKVIKGLEECASAGKCQDCVYEKEHPALSCKALLNDALELLKERKGKWERHYSRPGVYADIFWWCSCCGQPSGYSGAGRYYSFCPRCGARLEPSQDN